MDDRISVVLGIAAGLVTVADTVPYVRDTVRGTTRPHRGTWAIWTALAVVGLLAQRADGASWSLLLLASQAVLDGVVLGLALRLGVGGARPGDLVVVGIAALGVVGWILSDEPAAATACVIGADLVGVALMTPKAYRDPGSETLSTFALASLAGALAAAAVGRTDTTLLALPLYLCGVNAGIAAFLWSRRRTLAATQGPGDPPSRENQGAVRGTPPLRSA